MTFEAEILAQMQEHQLPDLPSGHPIFDGKYKRFGPGKKGWYILRKITLNSGKEVVTGAFGINQGDNHNTVPVRVETEALSKEEVAEYAARQQEFKVAEERKRIEAAHLASNRAKGQWAAASADGVDLHPYLIKKDVLGEGLRLAADGNLFIPLYRYSHDGAGMVGLQKITPAGEKLYNKGMDKIGASFLLGVAVDAPVIGVGEGYATCQSARMGALLQPAGRYDLPVMVAFDAGNIIHVARRLRTDFPLAHLLFLADDDFQLTRRYQERLREDFKIAEAPPIDGQTHNVVVGADKASVVAEWRTDDQGVAFIFVDVRCGRRIKEYQFKNAGVTACRAAAEEVGNASVVVPQFAARGDEKLTDFNDLQHAESIDVVAAQIGAAIATILAPAPPGGEQAKASRAHLSLAPPPPDEGQRSGASAPNPQQQQNTKRKSKPKDSEGAASAEGDGGKGRKAVKERSPEFWDTVNNLLDNFVLLYGTDTAWDFSTSMQIKINNVRLAYGSDQVKFWLNNPDRFMVSHKNLVFDPTLSIGKPAHGKPQHVNMFEGFTFKPRKGKCERILALLRMLCGNDEEVVQWILKWIAYPLQHPGAKMASSIIMHGDEGSGKNLFWEKVVAGVYGQYGSVIGNAQLEAPFNDWASRKLFFVCDEVVTNKEMRQMKGKLKGIISGATIQLNPKGLPGREEANWLNFVFLSNELQPLALDKTDRRYLVLWTPPKQDKSFYNEVLSEIEDGDGVAAFYDFLLNEVDTTDFGTHVDVPSTAAKEDLINLGLTSSERFFMQWSAGELPVPFISCGSLQLYASFQRWTTLHGERFPPSEAIFSSTIKRIGRELLERKLAKCELGDDVRQRTVFIVGKPLESQTQQDYVSGGMNLFEAALKKYRHVYDQTTE